MYMETKIEGEKKTKIRCRSASLAQTGWSFASYRQVLVREVNLSEVCTVVPC